PYRGVLFFLSEAQGSTGSETARVHHAARRCRCRLAARSARAAIATSSPCRCVDGGRLKRCRCPLGVGIFEQRLWTPGPGEDRSPSDLHPAVIRIRRRSQIFRATSFNCSVAISTATFLTQMAQNLCHSSPSKTWLHFVHTSTLGVPVGQSRFARSVIGHPR